MNSFEGDDARKPFEGADVHGDEGHVAGERYLLLEHGLDENEVNISREK